MKKNKRIFFGVSAFVLCALFVFIYKLNFQQIETEYISVSWFYNYGSVEEMTKSSDMIALVKVEDLIMLDNSTGGPYSTYSARIVQPIYNCSEGESINIYMTGGEKNGKIVEVIDDPLLKKNQEFLIFAAKNTDGTYRILSGPQGRMYYKDGKVNSLQNAPETFKMFAEEKNNGNVKNYSIDIKDKPIQDIVKEVQTYIENEQK